MTNETPTGAEANDFGKHNRVCDFCAIPLPKDRFRTGSKICIECTPKHQQLSAATITPEDQQRSYFDSQLSVLKESSEPQIVNGIQRAIELLGESPQEIIAKNVRQLMDPTEGIAGMTPEERAAIPRDHGSLSKYLKMLQEAQIHHDKTLEGKQPFEGVSPADLRATVLSNTLEAAQSDEDLRRELIMAFITRCPGFVKEVNEVAAGIVEGVQ